MTSNVKEQARELIDKLPENTTWDDIMYQVYVRQAIAAGIADCDAGRKIDVDDVKRELGLKK